MSRFFMCQVSGYVGVFRTCQGVSCYLRCTNLIIQYVKIRQNNMTGYVRCVRMSGYVRMCRRDVQDVSGWVMLIKIYNNTYSNSSYVKMMSQNGLRCVRMCQMCQDVSGCFGCVRMCQDVSGCVRILYVKICQDVSNLYHVRMCNHVL